jgi:hypothetical protein
MCDRAFRIPGPFCDSSYFVGLWTDIPPRCDHRAFTHHCSIAIALEGLIEDGVPTSHEQGDYLHESDIP